MSNDKIRIEQARPFDADEIGQHLRDGAKVSIGCVTMQAIGRRMFAVCDACGAYLATDPARPGDMIPLVAFINGHQHKA